LFPTLFQAAKPSYPLVDYVKPPTCYRFKNKELPGIGYRSSNLKGQTLIDPLLRIGQSRDWIDIGFITDQINKHWSKPRKPPTIKALTIQSDGEEALIASICF